MKKLSLTGSSAYAASAPVPQEMGTTVQRLFLQTHAYVLDSTVIQPLAFVNELTELVNFILSEACWLNPPASVSLNNNSTFPLFPWLIMSKKMTQFAESIQSKVHRYGVGNFSPDGNFPKLQAPENGGL